MRFRKSAMDAASSSWKPYFSQSTSSSGQRLSDLMCRSSPARVKNSRLRLPPVATFLGMRPTSSIISARWSSSRSYSLPDRGSNSKSPVASSNTRHATDQTSAAVPYLAPRITSGHRYCRVWISCVNCLYVQHAFPRSTTRHSTPTSSARAGVGPRPRETTARRGFSDVFAAGASVSVSRAADPNPSSSRSSSRCFTTPVESSEFSEPSGVAEDVSWVSWVSWAARVASSARVPKLASPFSPESAASAAAHSATAASIAASIASAAPWCFASTSSPASRTRKSSTSPGASAAHRASETASPSANASSTILATVSAATLSLARTSSQEMSRFVNKTFSGFRSVWMIFLRVCM